jgi:LmbE family N-acetylglucosaminyl deacetylase
MIGLTTPPGPLRVLALGAHPDDIEIGCGGTLLKIAGRPDITLRGAILTGSPARAAEAAAALPAFCRARSSSRARFRTAAFRDTGWR